MAQNIKGFKEKPDADAAQKMLDDGKFLWNAGIFLFRVKDILAAFKSHTPDLVKICEAALAEGEQDLNFFRLGEAAYGQAERYLD